MAKADHNAEDRNFPLKSTGVRYRSRNVLVRPRRQCGKGDVALRDHCRLGLWKHWTQLANNWLMS